MTMRRKSLFLGGLSLGMLTMAAWLPGALQAQSGTAPAPAKTVAAAPAKASPAPAKPVAVAPAKAAPAAKSPAHAVPAAKEGGVVVGLCDGETALEVKGVTEGTMTGDQAKQVADQLMAEWKKKNPNATWDWNATSSTPSAQSGPVTAAKDKDGKDKDKDSKKTDAGTQGQAAAPATSSPVQVGTYNNYTPRDEAIWAEETSRFVLEGDAIFHNADRLGSRIAMSCDMCHPNAANTHPETYPKYQVQLQRVALLRDMINWCLENPIKAPTLADDDPRMRALEAYILAQRKGTALDYGKH